jgi:L-seryl-tRNA(Ser) seleniumtransferase
VGPPVFKTGDAALGVAWWVRLPCAPASGGSTIVATDQPRPPSVERVLKALRPRTADTDPAALLAVARDAIAEEARRLATGDDPRTPDELADAAAGALERLATMRMTSVINATGVIIHTNLGRAPWPAVAAEAIAEVVSGYLLLELDRETGRRGARFRQAEEHLIALTGAADAFVTNNNAAAVALAIGLAGRGRGVAVSRGELVEIGGGVRIPDIIRRAGARLIEVGTTNRTRAEDFREPLESGRARLVLRVHRSNFSLEGFTEDPNPSEVASIAHEHGALVVDDLGSGALIDTAPYGLAHEPLPSERLAAGADVVTFSGDKLVGGPQAGLIVGRADAIARIRRDPLARAMRPDKATLVGVAATLGLYRAGRATTDIPVWQMIAAPIERLRARADALAEHIGGRSVEVRSTVGGGSLPGETLPSWAVTIEPRSAAGLLAALRRGTPSVVARIESGAVVLDVRTIEPSRDDDLVRAIEAAVAAANAGSADAADVIVE